MSKKLIFEVVSKGLHPVLKEFGFRRKSLTWNRRSHGYIYVINTQIASYSDTKEGWFTLNLGVFSPDIYTMCWQKTASDFVNEIDCVLRTRIN